MFLLKRIFPFAAKTADKYRTTEKIRLENLQKYYIDKIDYLTNFSGSPKLAVLACRDAPFKPTNLSSSFHHRAYVKSCLKHYKKKFKEVGRELKKVS